MGWRALAQGIRVSLAVAILRALFLEAPKKISMVQRSLTAVHRAGALQGTARAVAWSNYQIRATLTFVVHLDLVALPRRQSLADPKCCVRVLIFLIVALLVLWGCRGC